MFEIGDLVQFRKEGAFTKTREHPDKKIGLITDLETVSYTHLTLPTILLV